MNLIEFLTLCNNDIDRYNVFIYDCDGDYLDCGGGCHVKYLKYNVTELWLGKDDHICVKIDY